MLNAQKLRQKYQTEIENHKINGNTINDIYTLQNELIEKSASEGKTSCKFYPHGTIYETWEEEIKAYYEDLGFTFRLKNRSGGIFQDNMEICW